MGSGGGGQVVLWRREVKLRLAVASVLALAGCSTGAAPPPGPSATDQMLPSHSAEAVARRLAAELRLPAGARVDLDTAALDPANTRYLVGAIRAHLIGRGIVLVERPAATVIIELRVSANGIDAVDKVFGLAPATVPANTIHASTPAISIPEISLWSKHLRIARTEAYAVAYDAHTGRLVAAVGPVAADAQIRSRHFLGGLFVSGQELARPAISAHADP